MSSLLFEETPITSFQTLQTLGSYFLRCPFFFAQRIRSSAFQLIDFCYLQVDWVAKSILKWKNKEVVPNILMEEKQEPPEKLCRTWNLIECRTFFSTILASLSPSKRRLWNLLMNESECMNIPVIEEKRHFVQYWNSSFKRQCWPLEDQRMVKVQQEYTNFLITICLLRRGLFFTLIFCLATCPR